MCLHPEKTACIEQTQVLCYRELAHRCRAVGSALSHRIRPREPVAIYLDKGADALSAFFGVVYAGGFYVYFSPELPEARLDQMQAVLQARFVITDRAHVGTAEALFPAQGVLLLDELLCAPVEPDRLLAIRAGMIDTDPLYANFTSGSTGVPKGVVVSHRSVIDFIDVFTETFRLTGADRIGNQAPFDFDVSVKDIYAALKTGATLVVIPRQLFSRPGELLDYLCEHNVTVLIWAVSALCLVSTLHGLDYRTPHSVRQVLFSGEVMPARHLQEWMTHLPHARFVNLYGPTEITCNCTYHVVERDRAYPNGLPIGRAFPNEEVFLLDEDGCAVTQPGRIGEICVRGSALALGYLRAPTQTAAVFTPDPRNPLYAEPIYRTGDLGRYDAAGELFFCGRRDFQIKHMGHRIELEEIERAIGALPGVERCCCVYDEAAQKIRGFYIGVAEPVGLRRRVRERLPAFMVPASLVQLTAFPLTKNGKTDRQRLLKGGEDHAG